MPRHRRTAFLVALLLTLSVAGVACDTNGKDPKPPKHSAKPVDLTFGVWGTQNEIAAYQGMVDTYNSLSDDSFVAIRSWPDHAGLVDALEKGGKVPDVFMVSRGDLAWMRAKDVNQPVDELLDERGVDFGDGYSRNALEAFATENRLQCMPYGISPMVIFYNTALIDFARMRQRLLPAPGDDEHRGWNFDQFTAAAKFATRPRKGTRGVYIDPTLRGLSPFIYSGGGDPFNDDASPTSLSFSSDGSRSALDRTLQLLRDPHLTLTDKQLARATPLQWFERGRLGMIEGERSLVPKLRTIQGLEFDVMPMPVLDTSATVGDITGLCISRHAASTAKAADFLVHATSSDSVRRVAQAGYLAPANLQVAFSDDFLQPGRLPAHPNVFNAVRSMRLPPLLEDLPKLEDAVSASLQELVYAPGVLDIDALTTQIDEESRAVLDPASVTESPSP
ncbi:MAG: carbohydrate transporter substrate-binding protein family [Nocardioides sp.]|nr:carbohydrate transporter substrate-binding protein family [Nocardioides sp.]